MSLEAYRRVARHLHDGVVQQVVALRWLTTGSAEPVAKQVEILFVSLVTVINDLESGVLPEVEELTFSFVGGSEVERLLTRVAPPIRPVVRRAVVEVTANAYKYGSKLRPVLLGAFCENGVLTVTVTNTCSEEPDDLSTLNCGIGYGLSSLSEDLEAHDGRFRLYVDGMFVVAEICVPCTTHECRDDAGQACSDQVNQLPDVA